MKFVCVVGVTNLSILSLVRAIKGSHILLGADGTVCLSGLRKSIMLLQESKSSRIAHHFPAHAVAVLPWMAPEILQQVHYVVLMELYFCLLKRLQIPCD